MHKRIFNLLFLVLKARHPVTPSKTCLATYSLTLKVITSYDRAYTRLSHKNKGMPNNWKLDGDSCKKQFQLDQWGRDSMYS